MRLPWRKPTPDESELSETEEAGLLEAKAAAERAKKTLQATHRRGSVVDRVVARAIEVQEDNHFAERVQAALRRGYGESGGHAGGR